MDTKELKMELKNKERSINDMEVGITSLMSIHPYLKKNTTFQGNVGYLLSKRYVIKHLPWAMHT